MGIDPSPPAGDPQNRPPVIPLRDMLPCRTTPVVTRGIVLLNVAVFALTMRDLMAASRTLGAVASHYTGLDPVLPAELSGLMEPIPRTPLFWLRTLTHLFVHGGLLHLLVNMWFLWLFGDNVEDRLGRGRFVVLYLAAGLCALVSQVAADPASGLPMVGASGAVAGALGAYLVLFPHTKVLTLVPFGFFPVLITVRASVFLWFWLGIQVVSGLVSPSGPGVAWWAHIGGFVFGMALARPLAPPRRKRIRVVVKR